jgi:hypothetical protein
MKLTMLAAAAALSVAALSAPSAAVAAPAHASAAHVVGAKHACTRTSTHHCIQGGEFCPQASYGHSGWDAKGRRYVCKGNHQHPHWMKP